MGFDENGVRTDDIYYYENGTIFCTMKFYPNGETQEDITYGEDGNLRSAVFYDKIGRCHIITYDKYGNETHSYFDQYGKPMSNW